MSQLVQLKSFHYRSRHHCQSLIHVKASCLIKTNNPSENNYQQTRPSEQIYLVLVYYLNSLLPGEVSANNFNQNDKATFAVKSPRSQNTMPLIALVQYPKVFTQIEFRKNRQDVKVKQLKTLITTGKLMKTRTTKGRYK